ncbi:MAG: HD domain-containing protein, partial [Chloroflexi bacterium]|nr:HD domain-containing protein [Chloroflexota bacterium]
VKGTELSLEVRILGVCDVIEAMSSDRPYRAARPTQEVVQELRTGSGQRYDAQVVEAALKVVERGAFPLEVSGAYTGGNGRGEEKRLSHVEPVAGEGATLVERTAERGTGAPGSEPSGGNRLEEQPAEELLNLAETLSRAMASRDPTMTNHQRRVADFVVQVGTRLGLPAERLWGLRLGGLLHDVGKIAVPEFILTRPGRLSREELELVRTHPDAGYEILRDAGLPPVVPLLALHHHERLDGSGYPHGLTGDSLSMEDRILSVCNIVEAMGAHRPYRRGLGKKEVIAEIVTGRGTRYDPEVVDCVLGLLESGEFVLGE